MLYYSPFSLVGEVSDYLPWQDKEAAEALAREAQGQVRCGYPWSALQDIFYLIQQSALKSTKNSYSAV